MEAQLIEEADLLEYECSDGSQVIIATSEEVLAAAGITALHHGAQVLEVLHEGEDEDGNIILSAHNFTTEDGSNQIIIQQNHPYQPTQREEESEPEPESYKCKECEIEFATKKALKLHKTVHVDEAFYACEFCSSSKIHWTEMWSHQCTSVDSAPIVCPHCNEKLSSKKQLQVHEEVHDLQRRFTSKRMDGYFKRKLKEAEDPVVDWGAKPFICGVCGKQFGKLYEVEYHEKLHTGERPTGNKCSNCGLTYLNKHDLNKHNAIGCTGLLSRKTDAPYRRKSVVENPSSTSSTHTNSCK